MIMITTMTTITITAMRPKRPRLRPRTNPPRSETITNAGAGKLAPALLFPKTPGCTEMRQAPMTTSRTDDTLHHYEWLLTTHGEALMAEVRRRLDAGEAVLRVSEVLRREHDPALVALAITQVEL